MTRRLLNLLTALSLLLCVAVVGLWVRSYAACDWVKLSEVESSGGGNDSTSRITESRVLFSWRGRFAYVRSDESWGRGLIGTYRFFQRPVSERDLAQNAETLFIIGDMERRWNTRATRTVSGAGFRYVAHDPRYPGGEHVLIPWWSAFLVTAIAPVAAASCMIRRRLAGCRVAPGGCPSCGYDLTGNVSGVCPECGSQR